MGPEKMEANSEKVITEKDVVEAFKRVLDVKAINDEARKLCYEALKKGVTPKEILEKFLSDPRVEKATCENGVFVIETIVGTITF